MYQFLIIAYLFTLHLFENLENIQIPVNMIDRLDITDGFSVKRDFILNTVIFIDAALNISLRKFENVMFYDFIYLALKDHKLHVQKCVRLISFTHK